MTLADQMAADLDDVFFDTDEFAQTITYNGSSILALVDFGGGKAADVNAASAEIVVKASDVATPAYRDTVVVGGDTWRVHRDGRTGEGWTGDGRTWRIPILRDERQGIAR